MILANVVGTVVGTQRADGLPDARYLLVDPCSTRGEGKGSHLVALDMVSAGIGEMVMVAQGSATRQTDRTNNNPMDAIIVGIVDLIDEHGEVVYRK